MSTPRDSLATGEVSTYACTFGRYTQTAPWTDVRALVWPALVDLLTGHEVGPKGGTCIVPATFTGTRRHKNDAKRIDVAFLDSDAGATLDEIREAVGRHVRSAAAARARVAAAALGPLAGR